MFRTRHQHRSVEGFGLWLNCLVATQHNLNAADVQVSVRGNRVLFCASQNPKSVISIQRNLLLFQGWLMESVSHQPRWCSALSGQRSFECRVWIAGCPLQCSAGCPGPPRLGWWKLYLQIHSDLQMPSTFGWMANASQLCRNLRFVDISPKLCKTWRISSHHGSAEW